MSNDDTKTQYCCKGFEAAIKLEQGIKKIVINDIEYWCCEVLYEKPLFEDIDGEMKLVKRTYSTIKWLLFHCTFCGAKLDNE